MAIVDRAALPPCILHGWRIAHVCRWWIAEWPLCGDNNAVAEFQLRYRPLAFLSPWPSNTALSKGMA
jgi:hypothetical protein